MFFSEEAGCLQDGDVLVHLLYDNVRISFDINVVMTCFGTLLQRRSVFSVPSQQTLLTRMLALAKQSS
jgi:hypothetical protein